MFTLLDLKVLHSKAECQQQIALLSARQLGVTIRPIGLRWHKESVGVRLLDQGHDGCFLSDINKA